MIAQEPVAEDEPPPEEAPPEVPPSEDLGTGITGGNGPDMGLSGGGGGGGSRIGGSGRRGGGSRFGWYASRVQNSVAGALRRHPSTRNASMSVQVRVWPDSSGRVTRVQLVGSTGDPAVDRAIRGDVLSGLQLEAPPDGMPLPIVLRLTARRPGP